jgi:peptidoglycan hydrolase CwlO-like protein
MEYPMSIIDFIFGKCHCKSDILHLQQEIQMKITELTDLVNASIATLTKAHDEIVSKIDELNSKIADLEVAVAAAGEVPADVTAAIDALKTTAQSLDDIVPDQIAQ